MSVRVFYLLSKLRDVHPVVIDNVLNELFLAFVLPEEGRVGPFVLGAIFGDLIADFVEVVDDLG